MRPFLILLLAARLYAANCGGIVTMEDGQPAPGARVLFVPFESAGRPLFTSTRADGGWSCPATLPAGRYLVSALGSQLTAGQKYDLTINADGTVRANVPGVEAASLSFRLVSEASGESKKSAPLASPDQKAPARAGDITPMAATIEKISAPAPPPFQLSGTVSNRLSQPVPGATVELILQQPSGPRSILGVRTGSQGQWSIDLGPTRPTGSYTLRASQGGQLVGRDFSFEISPSGEVRLPGESRAGIDFRLIRPGEAAEVEAALARYYLDYRQRKLGNAPICSSCPDKLNVTLQVAATKANGDYWDSYGLLGSAPDPMLAIVPHGAESCEIPGIILGAPRDRDTATCSDSYTCSWENVSVPRLPFSFFAIDLDILNDDLIVGASEDSKSDEIYRANFENADRHQTIATISNGKRGTSTRCDYVGPPSASIGEKFFQCQAFVAGRTEPMAIITFARPSTTGAKESSLLKKFRDRRVDAEKDGLGGIELLFGLFTADRQALYRWPFALQIVRRNFEGVASKAEKDLANCDLDTMYKLIVGHLLAMRPVPYLPSESEWENFLMVMGRADPAKVSMWFAKVLAGEALDNRLDKLEESALEHLNPKTLSFATKFLKRMKHIVDPIDRAHEAHEAVQEAFDGIAITIGRWNGNTPAYNQEREALVKQMADYLGDAAVRAGEPLAQREAFRKIVLDLDRALGENI